MPRFIQPQGGRRGVVSGVEHRLTLQGLGVLIVEDEAMVAMLLEDLLHELGCHVVEIASRVETALISIMARIFDVVRHRLPNRSRDEPAAGGHASAARRLCFSEAQGKSAP